MFKFKINKSLISLVSLELFDLVHVVDHSPLENTSVHLTSGEEILPIRTELAVCDDEQMITVALIVTFTCHVRVVVQSDSAYFITNHYDRSSNYLSYLCNLVALTVPIMNTLKMGVAS